MNKTLDNISLKNAACDLKKRKEKKRCKNIMDKTSK
jgi:hypothetical protein